MKKIHLHVKITASAQPYAGGKCIFFIYPPTGSVYLCDLAVNLHLSLQCLHGRKKRTAFWQLDYILDPQQILFVFSVCPLATSASIRDQRPVNESISPLHRSALLIPWCDSLGSLQINILLYFWDHVSKTSMNNRQNIHIHHIIHVSILVTARRKTAACLYRDGEDEQYVPKWIE